MLKQQQPTNANAGVLVSPNHDMASSLSYYSENCNGDFIKNIDLSNK